MHTTRWRRKLCFKLQYFEFLEKNPSNDTLTIFNASKRVSASCDIWHGNMLKDAFSKLELPVSGECTLTSRLNSEAKSRETKNNITYVSGKVVLSHSHFCPKDEKVKVSIFLEQGTICETSVPANNINSKDLFHGFRIFTASDTKKH